MLTTTQYAEHELAESPILCASGTGWNRDGMHTCAPWWDGDHWLAAVDGIETWWSIGIYRTATPAAIPGPAVASPTRHLELLPCVPNPFGDATHIIYRLSATGESEPVRLRVYAVDGTLVWDTSDYQIGPGLHSIRWDGTDGRGTALGNGIYFYDLVQGGRTVSGRVIRVR